MALATVNISFNSKILRQSVVGVWFHRKRC